MSPEGRARMAEIRRRLEECLPSLDEERHAWERFAAAIVAQSSSTYSDDAKSADKMMVEWRRRFLDTDGEAP